MRSDEEKGSVSVRLSFGRVYGSGPERGKIKPSLEVSDATSGASLTVDLTEADLAELFAGGAAHVPAVRVSGHRHLGRWGRYSKHVQRMVPTVVGDYDTKEAGAIRALPYLAPVISELEAEGWTVETPRRNNSSKWVIIGRRYDETPD